MLEIGMADRDGDCGFTSLGTTRLEYINTLKTASDGIVQTSAPEIKSYLMTEDGKEVIGLEVFQTLTEIRNARLEGSSNDQMQVEAEEATLDFSSQSRHGFLQYLNHYYNIKKMWLHINRDASTGTLDAFANEKGWKIYLWEKNSYQIFRFVKVINKQWRP